MRKYFIHDGQNEKGPFDFEQLKLEQLKKDTPVWYEGLESWTTANEVEELKFLFSVKPPPLKSSNIESIPTSPLAASSYSTTPEYPFDEPKKKSFLLSVIIGGIIVVGIIGWLLYQNSNQAEKLDTVQQQFTQLQQEQQQKEREQQQKEQQQLLLQQQQQAEKDRVNAALTEKYMGYRNNWRNYITATSNRYTYSELGGISDLAVVVYNQTDKTIDEIQVRVDYIKANGGKYKSETVSVTNIGANSSKSVYAPTSERGTSVKMEIESIMAKSFHFCYPYGMDGNKNFDPYFCK